MSMAIPIIASFVKPDNDREIKCTRYTITHPSLTSGSSGSMQYSQYL